MCHSDLFASLRAEPLKPVFRPASDAQLRFRRGRCVRADAWLRAVPGCRFISSAPGSRVVRVAESGGGVLLDAGSAR